MRSGSFKNGGVNEFIQRSTISVNRPTQHIDFLPWQIFARVTQHDTINDPHPKAINRETWYILLLSKTVCL